MFKKNFKRIIAMALTVIMMMGMSTSVFAVEGENIEVPTLVIEEAASGIPDYAIQEIISENPNAGLITIIYWGGENNNLNEDLSEEITPYGYNYYDIKKTTTNTSEIARTEFITSAAKGQSFTLSQEWVSSLESSAGGDLSIFQLSLKSTMIARVSITRRFVGPEESSPYNSREFGMHLYQSRGTYSALRVSDVNPANRVTIYGDWTQPEKYSLYSVDSYQ